MDTLGFLVVVILAIVVFIFLHKRKKCCSSCSTKEMPVKEAEVQKQVEQKEMPVKEEPQVVVQQEQQPEIEAVAQPENKPEAPVQPIAQATTNTCSEYCHLNLPEDSILRRHYLTHLTTMIESVASPRPTDSVLCRHYDALLAARIDQCLTDNQAMEQLIADYEAQDR